MRARDPALLIGLVVSVRVGGRVLAVDPEGDHGVSPSTVQAADRLEAAIDVAGSPDWPLQAFGSIWVLAPDLPIKEGRGTPNLMRVDPATNEASAMIALADRLCQGSLTPTTRSGRAPWRAWSASTRRRPRSSRRPAGQRADLQRHPGSGGDRLG